MTTSEFIEQVICAAKRDHKARKTWQCYAGWARRYARWLRSQTGMHAIVLQVWRIALDRMT